MPSSRVQEPSNSLSDIPASAAQVDGLTVLERGYAPGSFVLILTPRGVLLATKFFVSLSFISFLFHLAREPFPRSLQRPGTAQGSGG